MNHNTPFVSEPAVAYRFTMPRSARRLRSPRVLRHPPVDAFEQVAKLRRCDRHHAVSRRRPDEAASLQTFGEQAHALAVMPQHLDQSATPAAEHEQMPAMRIMFERLLHLQRQALNVAEARATAAESDAKYRALLIEKLKFTIRKLRHERFGQSSERGALLEQLELQLADLEEDAAQAEVAARMAAAAVTSETIAVASFERRKPARRPLPEHLPRERIVYPAPSICPCCGGGTLRKIGEDVTETLELIRIPPPSTVLRDVGAG